PGVIVALASAGAPPATVALVARILPVPDRAPPAQENVPVVSAALSTRDPPDRARVPETLETPPTWSLPAEIVIGALLVRPRTASLAEEEWVMVPDLMLITTSSPPVGTLPPPQLAARSQSPPPGAIHWIVEGTMRGSSRSRAGASNVNARREA